MWTWGNIRSMKHLIFLSSLLFACNAPVEQPTGELPDSGLRMELPKVSFNKWTDYLSLQASFDEDCAFMDPMVANDSTVWPPLQVFWVIYDELDEVLDGDRIENVFFEGDLLLASDFPDKEGKAALGFQFLPPSQRMFLDIKEMKVSEDRKSIEATMGSPINTMVFAEVSSDGAGGCTVFTEYCEGDDPACTRTELKEGMYLELGALYQVKSIEYN